MGNTQTTIQYHEDEKKNNDMCPEWYINWYINMLDEHDWKDDKNRKYIEAIFSKFKTRHELRWETFINKMYKCTNSSSLQFYFKVCFKWEPDCIRWCKIYVDDDIEQVSHFERELFNGIFTDGPYGTETIFEIKLSPFVKLERLVQENKYLKEELEKIKSIISNELHSNCITIEQ